VTRVLLVSHEATRTGAPRVALQIARSLRDSDREVVSVLRAGGPLARDFERASDRTVREPFIRLRAGLRRFRRTRTLATRLDLRIARRVLRQERPALAYLNTVKSACYVRPAVELAIPVVLHVHELEPLASSTLARYRLDDIFSEISLAACSGAARDNLARITRTPPASIMVVPSTIDVDGVIDQADAHADDSGAGRRPLVVGACGTADTRKGIDLWLGMVALLQSARPELEVRFRWVGGPGDAPRRFRTDLEGDHSIEFCGEIENPYPAISEMDVFTLPSRTDAFPLVVLEAMALGRAIVAFALPGVVEQLGDAGVLVEPEDPEAMAHAVADLLDDPERRRELGAWAAERVRAQFGVEVMRESVQNVVTAAMRASDGGPEAAVR
jgi:glycosyltransferase involved in cell wall biosynthesis